MNCGKISYDKRFGSLQCIIGCFGIFLLLQNLIVENVSSRQVLFGELVKNLDEFFILSFFLFFLLRIFMTKPIVVKTYIEIPLIGFLIIGVLSSIVSQVPLYIASSQLILYTKGFVFFFILANLTVSEIQLKKYVKLFSFVSIFILFLSLLDLMAPIWFRTITGNIIYVEYRSDLPSIKSIFTQPDVFGWFMTFSGLYAFAFFIVFKRPHYLIFGLLFSVGTFLSMRAKSIIGLVIGFLAGLWPCNITMKVKYGLLFLFMTLLTLILFGHRLKGLYNKVERSYFKVESMQVSRNAMYIKSIEIAKDYFPFGAGLGRYGSWMSRVHYSPLYDKYGLSRIRGLSREYPNYINDTFWPMVLGETGVFGLIFYFWIMIIFGCRIYKQCKSVNSSYAKAFCFGTFMVFIENLIESVVHPIYTSPPKVYFIFGIIGICYSLSRKSNVVLTADV